MSKLTKNQKLALGKIEAGKAYTLKEAMEYGNSFSFIITFATFCDDEGK